MSPLAELLIGLLVGLGLVGVVVPVLPGTLLVWAGVLVWSLETQTRLGWAVLAVVSVLLLVAQVAKWTVPEKRLRAAGVPRRSMVYAGVLGVVGFFVVPVVGLPIGFVAALYLAERRRQRSHVAARASTVVALRLAGLSIGIELLGASLAAATWLVAAVTT
ncbi:MAG: DUF456 domain-containing protein [Actinomycetota bacterium]|nr:DUF456 domain-containing protein [Actinomycetota bacterium]